MCRGFKSLLRYQRYPPRLGDEGRNAPENLTIRKAIVPIMDNDMIDEGPERLHHIAVLDRIDGRKFSTELGNQFGHGRHRRRMERDDI